MQPFINIDLGGPAQPLLKVNRRWIPGQPPAAADGDDRQQRDNQHGQFYRPAKAL